MNVRIAKTWTALNNMEVVWKYDLSKSIKLDFFRAVVERVLFYGSNAWTLTKSLLRNWMDHILVY